MSCMRRVLQEDRDLRARLLSLKRFRTSDEHKDLVRELLLLLLLPKKLPREFVYTWYVIFVVL